LGVDVLGSSPQGKLAQRDQVALAKEPIYRACALLRHVNLPLAQAPDQLIRRAIDQFDVISLLEDAVRNGFERAYPGDLANDITQAFEMLDIDRGVDADAGGKKLLDVLPSLRVPRSRSVRMRNRQSGGCPAVATMLHPDRALAARLPFAPVHVRVCVRVLPRAPPSLNAHASQPRR
jgi:hypothetical protein